MSDTGASLTRLLRAGSTLVSVLDALAACPLMHSVRLADLAAVLSQHGPAILSHRRPVCSTTLARYWSSSRSRLELWHRAIARHTRAQACGDSSVLRRWWRDHLGLLEEILISDVLTRMTAALAAALDEVHRREELAPVTHAVHLAHLEASNRVQRLMLDGRGCRVADAVRLNRLRLGTERWTDALLGRMAIDTPAMMRYSIAPRRAAAHAEEMRSYGQSDARETVSWLSNAAMHETLMRRSSPHASLPRANREVADSVIAMLRPDQFDSLGALKSFWHHQLENGGPSGDRLVPSGIDDPRLHADLR